MPTFPDLDYSEAYSYEISPDVLRTGFASLNSRQRLVIQSRNDLFNVSLKLTDSELSQFEGFVIVDLENGALTYDGPYFTGDVEKTGTLQIVDGLYSVNYLAVDYWEVSFQYELKDRDLTDEEGIYNLVNAFSGFNDTCQVFRALENAVNNNNLNENVIIEAARYFRPSSSFLYYRPDALSIYIRP